MTPSLLIEDQLEIPFVRSLAEFRAWAISDDYPERGRIDYLNGRLEMDMSPEDLFCHGKPKTQMVSALGPLVYGPEIGELFTDRTRISCPDADVSTEPDIVFVSEEALESGRVRPVAKASGELDRYIEFEGPPDLIVEIVSDSSVIKDTQRLPAAYWRAGVREFWLTDARGEPLEFQIHHHGPEGYQAAPVEADGFQYSAVLQRWFRLIRQRNRHGRWTYELQHRTAEE